MKKIINVKIILLVLIAFGFQGCNNSKMNGQNSIGEFSSTNQRIGDWKYFDKNGDLTARGKYVDGQKEGEWWYKEQTYNGSNNVNWNINSNNLFKLNLPADWEVENRKDPLVILSFNYPDSISPTGNVTLIEKDRNLSLKELAKFHISQNTLGENHRTTKVEEIQINGLNAIYSQQFMEYNGEEIFIEQYLVEAPNRNYLLSFFVRKNGINIYHKIFTEVAYSFKIE